MDNYVILDLYWDRQTVRDSKGNVLELLRGIDYDLDWILMGECFAKFENVILKYDNLCFEKLKKTIDFDTFDLIVSNDNNTHYFKDKSKAYLKYYNKEYVLEGAEPSEFMVLDIEKGISKDDSRYYYYEKIIPFDLSKATILNDFYTLAEDKVFFCFQEIQGADAGSFTVLRENLGKDKNHVYFKGQIVIEADSETFSLLEGCINSQYYEGMDYTFYAKDKFLAYFIDSTSKSVKTIKSKSLNDFRFEIIDEKGFCFDKEYRYHWGKRSKK
jgi:ribosomal protein S24E